MVRPERIKTSDEEPETDNRFPCRILANNYFGDTSRYLLGMTDGKKIKVRNEAQYMRRYNEDDEVWAYWEPNCCVLL
jgi:ABC-type Fe3+/spermidine/putrescine transport system ATPase subunit